MRIFVANGKELHLTRHELRRVLQHPRFVGFFTIALLILISLRPYVDVIDLPVPDEAILWAQGVVVFLGLYFGLAVLIGSAGFPVYTLLLIGITTLCITLTGALTLYLLGQKPLSTGTILRLYLFHAAYFTAGEVLFVTFLMPRVLADIRPPEPEEPAPPQAAPAQTTQPPSDFAGLGDLILLGRRFAAADLRLIRAAEHYVEITCADGKPVLLRGRISDVEALLPATLGCRVHRSHWVAASALQQLRRDGDGWVVVLTTGTELPVARSRYPDVAAWAERLRQDA